MHIYSFFRILSVICLIFIFSQPAPVNAQQEKVYRTTVRIKVDADEEIKLRLLSFLRRELSSLGDVRVLETNPDWELFLVADEIKSGEGNAKSTVNIALLISKPFDNEMFSFLVKEKYKDLFLSSSENLYELKTQILYTGKLNELRKICERIVIDFDTKFIQQERNEFNITNENLKTLGK